VAESLDEAKAAFRAERQRPQSVSEEAYSALMLAALITSPTQQRAISNSCRRWPLICGRSAPADWLERRARDLLGQGLGAAGRDLAYIVVHGDAALDVIGGISSK
jgi:hypothetical protein